MGYLSRYWVPWCITPGGEEARALITAHQAYLIRQVERAGQPADKLLPGPPPRQFQNSARKGGGAGITLLVLILHSKDAEYKGAAITTQDSSGC